LGDWGTKIIVGNAISDDWEVEQEVYEVECRPQGISWCDNENAVLQIRCGTKDAERISQTVGKLCKVTFEPIT